MVKHLRSLAIAAATMVMLGGCAALGIGQSQTATDALTTAEKALTIAEDAHTAIGATLDALAKTGALHGQAAATAKTYYDQAGAALDAAVTADKAGNAQTVSDLVTQSENLVLQVHAITDPLSKPGG